MRRTGYLMLAVAALCAVAALEASGAYAELPEIGRCVKLEGLKEGRGNQVQRQIHEPQMHQVERELDRQVRMDAGRGNRKDL